MSAPASQPVEATTTADMPGTVEEVIVVPAEAIQVTAAPPAEAQKPAEAAPENVEKTEEATVEEKKEDKPAPYAIEHGILSKNSHGALLSFFKQKRFFYFHDDATTEENLKMYLYKDSANKSNAAYATQTGKGLWFYTKDESRKDMPHGIIKLADVTDVVLHGNKQFVLKLPTGDLHFEASPAERDNWVFTLKAKIEEAKACSEAVLESGSYKSVLEKLSKASAAAVVPPKSAGKAEEAKETEDSKAEEPSTEKTEAALPETVVTPDEEAATAESKDMKRTASKKGKRSSKFSDFFSAKKEKVEEKEKEKAEETKDDKPAADIAETAPVAAGIEEMNTVEETKAAEETPTNTTAECRPKHPPAAKRHSFFSMFDKKGEAATEKKDKEAAEVSKDTLAAEMSEGDIKPVDTPAVTSDEKPTTPSSPPKQKFLALLGKRDKSPSPKAVEEKTDAPAEVKIQTPVQPVISSEVAAETPKESAESPSTDAVSPSTKEKRKSSFFSFKKEKKSDEVKSDTEDAACIETHAPAKSTSPVPKGLSLQSFRRKVSLSGKAKETETKEVASPAAVVEEGEQNETPAAPKTAEPVKAEQEPVAPVIGDVVPDAVTIGQTRPVQAAA